MGGAKTGYRTSKVPILGGYLAKKEGGFLYDQTLGRFDKKYGPEHTNDQIKEAWTGALTPQVRKRTDPYVDKAINLGIDKAKKAGQAFQSSMEQQAKFAQEHPYAYAFSHAGVF